MDGNGRWAKNRGLKRTNGHQEGVKNLDEIVEVCIENGIENLTLYAFSTENWKRPKSEIEFLLKLLAKFLDTKKESFIKNDIKFHTIGDLSAFDKSINEKISSFKEETKLCKKLNFILAINYGAQDEIVRAANLCVQNGLNLSKENIEKSLDTAKFGNVDLLIRTGGEVRISNFLLWQISYAELSFTNTLWPDFGKSELLGIIENFHLKNRRFGGL